MKKQLLKTRVLTLIIILTCILHFTCKPDTPEEAEYYDEYTNVVYSPELNAVTIYLKGRAPVPRALSRPLALMGCDYFEVNFMDSAGNLTRAEWMAGKIAGVSDLPAGNYGGIVGASSALLFAGKSDKTLMALGRLTAVDGVNGTTITANSKTVTFTLRAVLASVSSTPANSSFKTAANDAAGGYQTVNATNTAVTSENIFYTLGTSKTFPCFELERLKPTVNATYEFDLSPPATAPAFNDYGIFASPPAFAAPGLPVNPVERKAPRYTSEDGKSHESILLLDEKTTVILTNNNPLSTDQPYRFRSTVEFTFNTMNTINGSVFSFAFSVPVYALKEVDKDGKKSRWYVRSSYGPNLYDLDDGTVGMGGGVLIKTGHIPPPALPGNYILKLVQRPAKWQYTLATNDNNRRFEVDELQVDLYKGNTLIRTIPYDELEFIIGKSKVNAFWTNPRPPAPTLPSYVFDNMFFGLIEVTVSYTEPTSGQILKVPFYVLVSGMGYDLARNFRIVHIYTGDTNPGGTGTLKSWYDANHPPNPGKQISGSEPHDKINNTIDNPEAGYTVIVILHESFDFRASGTNLNPSGSAPTLFIFVAGARLEMDGSTIVDNNTTPITYTRNYYDAGDPAGDTFTLTSPDVVIGRRLMQSGTTKGSRITQKITSPAGMSGIISYYFGDWPFSSKIAGVGNTYPFKINTRGHFSQWVASMNASDPGTAPNIFTNKLITDGFKIDATEDGGVFNVKVGLGMMPISDPPPNILPADLLALKKGAAMVQPYDEVDGYNPGEKIPVYPYLH